MYIYTIISQEIRDDRADRVGTIHCKCDACACLGDKEQDECINSIDAYCNVSERYIDKPAAMCTRTILHVYLPSEKALARCVGKQWIRACGRIFHYVNVLM